MTLLIRRYQCTDHEHVRRLHNVALEAAGFHAGNGPWDEDLNRIEDVYLNARGDFLVGILDEQVVAMGALRAIDADTAEIKRMRVLPELQRRGLGRRMLHALEARAAELGYSAVVLDSTERQSAAIALYRSEGYLETGRTQLAGMPAILFRKALASETIDPAHADATDDRPGTAISG